MSRRPTDSGFRDSRLSDNDPFAAGNLPTSDDGRSQAVPCRPRKALLVGVGLGTALIVSVGAVGALYMTSGDSALEPERPRRTFYLKLIPKQKAFTVSTLFIKGAAGKELEILEVRPLGSPNVAYLGAITVWPRDRGSVSDGGEGFPTRGVDTYHPAIGTVVPASETAFLHADDSGRVRPVVVNAGFRLVSGSVGFVNGVEVVYRIGGDKKRERARTAMIVCMEPCAERGVAGDLSDWMTALREELGIQELAQP